MANANKQMNKLAIIWINIMLLFQSQFVFKSGLSYIDGCRNKWLNG